MPIKLTRLLLLALLISTTATVSADDTATKKEDKALFKVLLRVDNNGFTPPAKNSELQAMLAKRPPLTFFEACGVGDAAEVARQLKRDPKLAAGWSQFGFSAL